MSDQTNNSEEDVKLSNKDADTQVINKDSPTAEVAEKEAFDLLKSRRVAIARRRRQQFLETNGRLGWPNVQCKNAVERA